MLGGAVYFGASLCGQGTTAVGLIFLGRLLGGLGAANQTLGFTFIAQVVDKSQLTKASAVLSMVRVFGMATAPALNVLLDKVKGSWTIGEMEVSIDPLNSVGLFLVVGNAISFAIMYFFLEEPPPLPKRRASSAKHGWDFYKSIFSLGIIVPMLSIFSVNCNFQLMDTGMAPAANDALGWGPVGVSSLFGANAVLIFFAIVLVFQLTSRGVTDDTLMMVGLVFSVVGYTLMYLLWKIPTTVVGFALPVVLSTLAFPFLGSPTRSLFTRYVDSDPTLRDAQGTMQAILSMVASVAGFVAPGVISSYILRKPEEVAASSDGREFTVYALFAPIFSACVLILFLYQLATRVAPTEEEKAERVSLMSGESSTTEFDPRTEAWRRQTVTFMGIPQITFHHTATDEIRRTSTGMMLPLSDSLLAQEAAGRRQTTLF